jgi:8-oxo-dGTP pyrophosphatase MutT (NUDIX family)
MNDWARSGDLLLAGKKALVPSDAAAAILIREDGKYILQLRSAIPDIWYPAHWGLFGGATEPGENSEQAIIRELSEELDFTPREIAYFTNFDFDLTKLGRGICYRAYYTVPVTLAEFGRFRLGEGDAIEAMSAEDLFGRKPITPYDAFALWLHHARGRIEPPNAGNPDLLR